MQANYKLSLIFIASIVFIRTVAQAQSGGISGKVSFDNKPLHGAVVSITDINNAVSTDAYGAYRFNKMVPGVYRIKVSFLGFISIEKTIELKTGEDLLQNFTMHKDVLRLEGVVITGTRNQIAKYEAPVIVNTISNRTFETTQSLSISEGLNFSPGLRMENNCQNCGFSQLRMNGLDGSYSQILINSRPIFSALAGVYGLEMLPANLVDRIEVVRGGGSALYGGSAIGGTVNIITKDPVANSFETGINQSFADFETPDRTITLNGAIVSDDLSMGINIFGYNRSRDPWDSNGDGFSEMTKLRNNTFGFDTFWNVTERSKLKLGLYFISEFRRGGNKFDLQAHQSDITEQLDHRITSTHLSFEQYSGNLKHKISIYGSAQFINRNSYYGTGGRVLNEHDTVTENDIIAINAYGKSEDVSAAGGIQYNYEINKKYNFTTGAEYQYNDVKDEMPGYNRMVDQQAGTIGTYTQLEIKPTEKLTLLLGGRYDNIDIKGRYQLVADGLKDNNIFNVFIPRMSALYVINKDLKLRVSYAQGYRTPQAFDEDLHVESVGGDMRFIMLSPNLKIEKSNSITGSLNYSKTVNSLQLNFVAEGFYTHLENPFILSGQTTTPNGTSVIIKRNGSGAHVQGVNLEANFALGSKFIFQSAATIQSAKYSETEEVWTPEDDKDTTPATYTDRILRTPNLYGYFTIAYKPVKSLALSYSGVITGTMNVPHVIDPDNEQTIIKSTPLFFENNIKAAYTFKLKDNSNIEIFTGVQNMLNSFQSDFDKGINRDAGYIYGPSRPRTLFIGLKFRVN